MKKLEEFKTYISRINQYDHAAMLLSWDMATNIPINGAAAATDSITMLSSESFKLLVSDDMKNYVDTLSQPDTLNYMDAISRIISLTKEINNYSKPNMKAYAIGNIYGGMFLAQIEKELGSIDKLILDGKLDIISKWLSNNIHQYGMLKTPSEIINDSCGCSIDTAPIIKYYIDKYSAIYDL